MKIEAGKSKPFFLIVWILFVFPEASLPMYNVSLLTFSLALPVFSIWALSNYQIIPGLIKVIWNKYIYTGWFCIFSIWGLLVSCMSLSPISILYALYHFIFVFGSALIIVRMYEKVGRFSHGSIYKIDKNIALVGFVVAIGTIISTISGPIYEHQTLWTSRRWDDDLVLSGVGFSSNPNQNAIYLCFFFYFILFAYQSSRLNKLLFGGVVLLALGLTLSRTGIAAFSVSITCLILMQLFNAVRVLAVSRKTLYRFLVLGFIGAVYFMVLAISVSFNTESSLLFHGFSYEKVLEDFSTRYGIWSDFVETYTSSDSLLALVGSGRRTSSVIDYWGTWFTPHNAFLSIFGEYGLVGVGLILFILLRVMKDLIFYIIANPCKLDGNREFCFLFILTVIVASMAEEHLLSPINGFLIVFTLVRFQYICREGVV